MVFPDGSDGKESVCNAGDLGLIPGLGRSLGKENGELKGGRPAPGSLAYVPSVMGLIMAGQVIDDLIKGGLHENA